MGLQRKKPFVIEFFKFEKHIDLDSDLVPDWIKNAWSKGILKGNFKNPDENNIISDIKIETLEGLMSVKNGNYILKGIAGEIYPCDKEIFEESYEILEKEPSSDIVFVVIDDD